MAEKYPALQGKIAEIRAAARRGLSMTDHLRPRAPRERTQVQQGSVSYAKEPSAGGPGLKRLLGWKEHEEIDLPSAASFDYTPLDIISNAQRELVAREGKGKGAEIITEYDCIDWPMTAAEMESIFSLYVEHLSIHLGILTPKQQDAAVLSRESPFLFASILHAAVIYHPRREEWQEWLYSLTSSSLNSVLASGSESVEIAQALLVLSVWSPPLQHRDKTWQLLGIALRMTINLDLHRLSSDDDKEDSEEKVKRGALVYVQGFIQDRSVSTQMGKPTMLPETALTQGISNWTLQTPKVRTMTGIHIELHQTLRPALYFMDPTLKMPAACLHMADVEQELGNWRERSRSLLRQCGLVPQERHFRLLLNDFFYHHYRLLVGKMRGGDYIKDASEVLNIVTESFMPLGYLKWFPDNYFVFITYAGLSLLHSSACNTALTQRLLEDTCQSLEESATYEEHTPALCARFLRRCAQARTIDHTPNISLMECLSPTHDDSWFQDILASYLLDGNAFD